MKDKEIAQNDTASKPQREPDWRGTRRAFIRDTSLAAAGAVAGALVPQGDVLGAQADPAVRKTLCYNPEMEYRRLGKTGLWVSAVALGGHWKRVNVMNQDFDQNRHEVVSRCMEVGINYIDACWDNEVKAYSKALAGRRDKMFMALSNGAKEPRFEQYRTAKKLLESLDELLRDSNQEYTDLWRITCFEPGGRHAFDTSCEIAEALETAKKQGKARFIGFSSHDRRWIKFMIEYFPQIDVVLFPYTAKSKAMPEDSVFDALKKCDVGAFGIKPFASNSLFKGSSAPDDPNAEEDDRRARLALRYILCNPHLVPIPGLVSIHQVDNVAKAVKERRELDVAEAEELRQLMDRTWAKLPPNYQWLKNWEYV
ncbi:MAG TPA: aldo/keto reductase [Sedimentisphaerales bacterium]|nr:aldo/keto reductase [Sedimentisphaerales bacterium]